MKPQVKPEHAPHRISGGKIRIGGVSYGIAAEIKDPSGAIWDLLSASDGTRSPDEIIDVVLRAHQGISEDTLRAALNKLLSSGYMENAEASDPPELTERDKERHDRGRRYFRWLDTQPRFSTWEPQVALKRSKVTVVGVGGTGGAAAMALAASGVGTLHCVDPDTVELSNLNRQVLFTEDDIGYPKVDTAVKRLSRLNSDINITGARLRMHCVEDFVALALDCDTLLVTADRPPAVRTWANRACLSVGRQWVDAGYHGPLVSVACYKPGKSACWECLRLTQDEAERREGVYSEDAPHRRHAVAEAVAAPSAGLSGYLAAHAVISLLTGAGSLPPGQIQAINLGALHAPFTFFSPRRQDCPACGID